MVARGLSTVNRGTPSQHEIQMSLNCADIVISGHHGFYSATTILESVGNTITMLNIIKKRHFCRGGGQGYGVGEVWAIRLVI